MMRPRAALLLVLALGPAACSAPPDTRMRLVLVTLDTLRHDAFAASPRSPSSMPRLLARAEGGTRFARFYAASSSTQPTHASLLTGLHPWQHGVTRNGEVLDARFQGVAQILSEAGFETAAIVASYPVAAEFGFGRGFDSYREDFTTGFQGARSWEGHRLPPEGFFSRAETVTDRALEALDAATARRQFFWLHYFDPHSPYGSSRGSELLESDVFRRIGEGESASAVVDEVVRGYRDDTLHLDQHLDRLLSKLEAEAGRFETHVVLVSDHGESLGEGGSLGHGYGLPEVEIRVPAVIFSPVVAPGLRDDVAGSVDVAATLLAIAGVGPVPSQGRDLRAPGPGAVAVGMRRTFRTSRPGSRRLDGSVHAIPELLFYSVDQAGRLRLGNGRRLRRGGLPAEDEILRERFRSFERELARHAGGDTLDPAVEQRLRALGYAP
jgi:arylsulfatase A-like enzyme